MTADPLPGAAPRQDDEQGVRDDDVAHPLSTFVHGVLTVHFDGGSVVTRDVSQFDARAFLGKQQDTQSNDAVRWDTRSWIHWVGSRVVFSSFDADRDQTWPVDPQDRRRLTEAGHPHGVVASLVSFWEGRARREEPQYSISTMALLHRTALSGTDRATWEALARTYEGTHGAARLAQIHADTEGRMSVPVDTSDDDLDDGDDLSHDRAQAQDRADGSADAPGTEQASGEQQPEVAPAPDDLDISEPPDGARGLEALGDEEEDPEAD